MLLKKLNKDHYILITDERIKKGDWITDNYKCWQWMDDSSLLGRRKVIASTKPLNPKFNDWFDVRIIELSDIQKLIGEIDLEDIAEEISCKKIPTGIFPESNLERRWMFEGIIEGYNKCLEDNKDKKFSFSDMQLFAAELIEKYREGKIDNRNDVTDLIRNYEEFYYTSWEVEFDSDNNLKLK